MVRIRFYSLTLAIPLIMILTGFTLVMIYGPVPFNLGMAILLGGLLLQCFCALALACPRCGKSLYGLGPSIGPFSMASKPWPDAECYRCGYDFRAGKDPSITSKPEQPKS